MTVIASLITSLGLDSSAFTTGLDEARKKLRATQKQFAAIGGTLQKVGAAMTVGVTAPFAAAARTAVEGALAQRQAVAQVTAALQSMGPVAGKTANQLSVAADQMEMRSLFDADEILKKVTANLLTFGRVSGREFDRAQQAALDLAQRMGGDLQGATILIGKALNDPVRGLASLGRVGVQFTAQQREQIKSMTDAGNVASAQRIILGELERQYRGAASAAAETDPYRRFEVAIGQASDVVGEALLPAIRPAADALAGIAGAFTSLTSETQRLAIYTAAAAAALGPIAGAAGTLLQITGPLLPRLATLGGPLALGAVAAGAAAVVIAWKNWDQIGPWIDGVVQRTTVAAGQINQQFGTIQGAADRLDQRLGVPGRSEFIAEFVRQARQDSAVINAALISVQQAAASFDAAIAAAFRSAVSSAQALYVGVKTWIGDRLSAVFDSVREKVAAVGDWFYQLYDRVVGHSYVPDMVDEIGQQMRRLDGEMVQPARAATSAAAQAFLALRQRVGGILQQLYPEQAQVNDLQLRLADLDRALAERMIDPKVWADARERLIAELYKAKDAAAGAVAEGAGGIDGTLGGPASANDPEGVAKDTEAAWARVKAANDNARRNWAETARDIAGSLGGLVRSIKSGDWLDALSGVLDAVAQIGGILNGTGQPATRTFPIGPGGFGGFRAAGGPVLPNRSYIVGERGPELLRMGRQGGAVIANDQIGAPMSIVVQVEEGALFRPVVRSEAAGVSYETARTSNRAGARAQRQALG